ncbi:uncharacterized protein LOC134278139 [Saccostrea cucullata]|uniref:uncharacterized protein LOC134278139 n=1 Tax=Saccostrea cuccullata TaxID=36930 RepID=UPI002ED256B6
MECHVNIVRINIVSRLSQNSLAECYNNSGNINCFNGNNVKSFYNGSSGLLVFITEFNHTHHAGYRLWVNATCHNQNNTKENVLLKPCVSGFRTSAYHNGSHVTITCEHDSFKMSEKGIRIVDKQDLAHCWWNIVNLTNHCFGEAEALENGLQLTRPYTAEMNISCKFDEQSTNIKAEELTSTTATTLTVTHPTNTMTTYDTTSSTTPIPTSPKQTTTRATTRRRTTASSSYVYAGSGKTNQISTTPFVFTVFIYCDTFR